MIEKFSNLGQILRDRRLHAHFQPVLDDRERNFIGYEALIRGPTDSVLATPDALFSRAETENRLETLETLAWEIEIEAFAELCLEGLLFLNASAEPLGTLETANALLASLKRHAVAPEQVVLEITEHTPIGPQWQFNGGLSLLRRSGMRIALDDYGTGYANALLLKQLKPEIVKLDGIFFKDADSSFDPAWARAMAQLADHLGIQLLAEGIESLDAMERIRRCGIRYAQGYWIARPASQPPAKPESGRPENGPHIEPEAPIHISEMTSDDRQPGLHNIATQPPALNLQVPNHEVAEKFECNTSLMLVPVVNEAQQPIGLIERYQFLEGYAQRYGRELFGKRSCAHFMQPLEFTVEQHESIQSSAARVARAMENKNIAGLVVTENGRYFGVVPLARLMGVISEMQLAAARYANPLTNLPGNVPINDHIDALLETSKTFTACYVDIDQFKPFNDQYGYSCGDDLITALANSLKRAWSQPGDFIGHIGGDDFFCLFERADGMEPFEQLQRQFDRDVARLSLTEHVETGGYLGASRRGKEIFQPLPTLSVGVVQVRAGQFSSHRELSDWLARAKKMAKAETGHTIFIERREPSQRD